MEQVAPEIEVYVVWLSSWFDARLERVAAERLILNQKVEGIAQHTDSIEPQMTAKDLGKVGVGYHSDVGRILFKLYSL